MNLKRIRKSKGISRYKLAKLSGLNESTLQNIENSNDPNPTFKVMCKLADALGITLDDLRR
ncbi:helix-turn-helix domain-containing protein [Virgibacillus sp. W0430]|uniref:helix-turn-helix domain-containing protein n=1 Tax=Virgibacillus sp. W0430 TaxID=3391580 RepID=UPI003F486F97